jgi:thioredoxin
MLMVSFVLWLIAVVLLGVVGGVVYMNREKLGIPPVEKWRESFELAVREAGERAESAREDGGTQEARRPVVAAAPMHVDQASFARAIQRSDVLILVDYYADWCGPCKQLAPSLAKLAQQHGDKVIVLKVNVDAEQELAQQAGVRSIPDVRLLHGGKEVDRFIGLVPYDKIENFILEHESLLPPPRVVPALPGATGEGSIDPVTGKYLPPGMSREKK